MARTLVTVTALLAALLAGFYQLYLKSLLATFGVGRVIESIGNQDCVVVPELQACEKIVLHQPSGVLYLACSTPSSRTHWTPAADRLDPSKRSEEDYVATYDPQTSAITHLKIKNFASNRGLSLLGMDVVPSSSDPNELFVYLVNHRPPLGDQDPKKVGADSVVEIFKTRVGSTTLTHLRTVEDPTVIICPNDVVGSPDGKSFHFTNDHAVRTGLVRSLVLFGHAVTSVGYCHVDEGCKIAISNMHGNNGITRANNDTFYVANVIYGGVSVLEKQSDNSLVLTEVIPIDRGIDNLSVDDNGILWGAGLPKVLLLLKHFEDPSVLTPSSALRISLNEGPGAYYGEKYKVDKVFEDDGSIASGITSVVHDSQRGKLYLHGVCSPRLVVCNIA